MGLERSPETATASQSQSGGSSSSPGGGGAAGALKSGLRGTDFAAGERALAPVQKQDAKGWVGKSSAKLALAGAAGLTAGKLKGTSKEPEAGKLGGDGDGDGATTKAEGMTGISQFVWISASGKDLTYDQAKERIATVCGDMKLGTYGGEITAPTEKEKGYNPNNGYYWFKGDGTPTWSGSMGGVKAIKVGMKWSNRLNAWSDFMSSAAPGKRSGYVKDGGGDAIAFAAGPKDGYVEVPQKLRDLDVKHVPGARSCFATVTAMLDEVGLTPVKGGDGFGETVKSETYTTATQSKYDKGEVADDVSKRAVEYLRKGFVTKDALTLEVWYALHPEKVVGGARQPVDKKNADEKKAYDAVAKVCQALCKEKKTVASVEVDLKASRRSLAYIDFETSNGRAVMTGVTYSNSNGNGAVTDHWVVINARQGEGKYGYYDPAAISTASSEDKANVFVWNEGKGYLQSTAKHPYIVSWVRPNAESLKDWQAHEATLTPQ